MKKIITILLLMLSMASFAQNKFRQPVNMYDTLRLFKGAQPGKFLKCVTDSGSCAWVTLPAVDSNSFWNLNGNAGITSNKFIGTTDAKNFQLKSNGNLAMYVDTFGSVAICDSVQQDIDFTDSADGYYKLRVFAYDSPYIFKLQAAHNNYNLIMGNENDGGLKYAEYAMENTDTSTEVYNVIVDDSLFYQNGIFYYTDDDMATFSGRSPEISIYNTNTGNDIVRIAAQFNPLRNMGYFQIHVDDTLFHNHEVYFENMEVVPDDSIWNLGSANHKWRHTYTYGLTIPTSAGVGKILTSDANGNATWQGGIQKDSIALIGATVILQPNTTHIVTASGTITNCTFDFPAGNTNDDITIQLMQDITTLTFTGTGISTITTPVRANTKLSGVRIFHNYGGNWY